MQTKNKFLPGYFEMMKSPKLHKGVSGPITFTAEGSVAETKLSIVNFVHPNVFQQIGVWSSTQGLDLYASKHAGGVQFLDGAKDPPKLAII